MNRTKKGTIANTAMFKVLQIIGEATIPPTPKQIETALFQCEQFLEYSLSYAHVAICSLRDAGLIRRVNDGHRECPSCGKGHYARYVPTPEGLKVLATERQNA